MTRGLSIPLVTLISLEDFRSCRVHTPLDVKIQCAGLLTKYESPAADEQKFVVHMPPALPGDSKEQQLAVWWAVYGDVTAADDPEWDHAVKLILERAATKAMPERLS